MTSKTLLLGKANPYGVYDILNNQGWVSIGIDHDTAAFAVNTIRRWWKRMGRRRFPKARELFVTADSGGSNGLVADCGRSLCRNWPTRPG